MFNFEGSKSRVINIGTGKKTKVSEVIESLIACQKDNINVKYEGGTPGDIHGIHANTKLMDDILGRWKKIELKEGLKIMVKSYV